MELFQIVLPLYDNAGTRLPRDRYAETLRELTDAFGGATAFTRSPAEGFWEDGAGRVTRDDVIVVEVMVESAEAGWWAAYKQTLEHRFVQERIVIRALRCRLIE